MCIDPHASDLRLIEEFFFSKVNYLLLTATNISDGLHLASMIHPDLIFLNIELRDELGGRRFFKMDTKGKLRYIPIISVIDSHISSNNHGSEFQTEHFIAKPIDFSELQYLINSVTKEFS